MPGYSILESVPHVNARHLGEPVTYKQILKAAERGLIPATAHGKRLHIDPAHLGEVAAYFTRQASARSAAALLSASRAERRAVRAGAGRTPHG